MNPIRAAESSAPWSRRSDDSSTAWMLLDALWEAPVGIALVDRQLRFVRVNATLASMIGYPAEQHLGRSPEALMPGVDLWRRDQLLGAIDSGEPVTDVASSGEWPMGSRNVRHWLASYYPVRGDSLQILGVVVVLMDVTERRRAEQAAERSHAEAERAVQSLMRLQAVTSALAAALTPAEVARVVLEEGVGLLDAAAGSISRTVAPGELEILDAFGYPEKALVAWRRYAVDLPAPLAEAFRTGLPVWLESPDAFAQQYPHLAPAARPFPGGASAAVPLVVEARVIGVLGVDFAEPMRFEPADRSFVLALSQQCAEALERARLYENQERLRAKAETTSALLDTLFSSVPIGLAFVDWNLRFVHANAAWGRLHGAPPDACAGKKITELIPGAAGLDRARQLRRVLETGEPVLEVELSGKDPTHPAITRVWLESWYPVVAGGQAIGVGLVAREVTEAKRAEEYRKNVIGIVGHDLRNPLSALIGYAKLLERTGGLDERQRRMLSRIEAGAAKVDRIARDLLDLTRVEAGRTVPIDPRPARVDEICATVAEEAGFAYPGRTIRCTGRGDPEVEWDADRVSQAVSNLVVNALKYGFTEQPVEVEWVSQHQDVAIRVHNWGPPIPPELRGHIFEAFRQGGQADARASGIGLGLYIAREILRAHGGDIEASSTEAEGTAFTIHLPRRVSRP